VFCSKSCRQKAARRRAAGLAEDAFRTSGRCGSVSLRERADRGSALGLLAAARRAA
jgi:hypothetical protein